MTFAAAALALLALAAGARAEPAQWRVDPAASEIGFAYGLNGTTRSGTFAEVEGEGSFDADDLAATRMEVRIAARGLRLEHPVETAFAQGPEWFDAANHPFARYRLARLEPPADGAPETWTALGDLTIKGATVIVRAPLALSIGADTATASGALTVNRRDFDLGLGLSDVVLDIADEVTVRFALTLRAAPPE